VEGAGSEGLKDEVRGPGTWTGSRAWDEGSWNGEGPATSAQKWGDLGKIYLEMRKLTSSSFEIDVKRAVG